MSPIEAVIEQAWRNERAGLVAVMARRFSDLTLAEDAVQEAFAAATMRWPIDGIPRRPGAWLTTVAHRKAIGMLRKHRPTTGLPNDLETESSQPSDSDLDRDLFGLLLACCHPSLTPNARVALTLRHVCGLTDSEIAAHMLVSEGSLTKRLVRARRKIRDASISFDPPGAGALPARINDVHTVVYVVFTEGHLSTGASCTLRGDLCDEAIWLARQVRRLQPRSTESAALLALLLIQNSRRDARESADGKLVSFPEQDRSQWDQDAIDEARGILAGIGAGVLGRFQVEAAIALLHVSGDEPNWPRIADLYMVLSRLAPSPVVEINRAVAVGRADGPHAGLAIINRVLREGGLDSHPSAHAAHAQLLEASGRLDQAADAWALAAATTHNPVQRRALLSKARRLNPSYDPSRPPAGPPA